VRLKAVLGGARGDGDGGVVPCDVGSVGEVHDLCIGSGRSMKGAGRGIWWLSGCSFGSIKVSFETWGPSSTARV